MPDGKDGELQVVVWDSFTDTGDGRRYVSDFNDIRIDQDGMVFTIAFVPEGTDIPMPPWAAELPELGAADQGQTAPTTTVAGATAGSTPVDTATARHRRRARRPPPASRRRRRRRRPRHRATDHHRLMRAVVLVGGFGTRLRPLTDTHPQADAADRPRPADRPPRRAASSAAASTA